MKRSGRSEVLTVSKGSVDSTQRITNDDREHDGGDGDIKPVLLHDEVKKREYDTSYWREDEYYDPYLHATGCIAMENALPQTAEGGVVGLCCCADDIKMSIVGHGIYAMLHEIIDAANGGKKTSENDSPTERVAYELLDVHIRML